jgi:hypothetical protein
MLFPPKVAHQNGEFPMQVQSSQVDHKTARIAAYSAACSYESNSAEQSGLIPRGTGVEFIERDNIEVVVQTRPDGRTVIAFRGTDEAQDVVRDLRFCFARGPLGGDVHSGFLSAWRAVRDEIKDHAFQAKSSKKQIIFTGHSLGGAIATLAHAQARSWGLVTACYTFGAPRVGDRDFAREYERERLHELHYRMVMEGDPVPGLPPAWLGFRHVGSEVYATSKGHLQAPPGNMGRLFKTLARVVRRERDHSLAAYEEALSSMVPSKAREAA